MPTRKGFIKCDGVRIKNGKIDLLNPAYKISLEQIKLDRDGYSKEKYPTYYGIGAPVFRYESHDGNLSGEFRANNRAHAREILIKKLGKQYGALIFTKW